MNDRKRDIIFLALLLGCSSALLLTHLTQSYLWNDEGSTALIARTILQHGVPMGNDGVNSVSAEEGRDLTKGGIYKFQPWLQFYATAASFAVLGESTFSARLPFALFGIATILLAYFLALEIWKDRATAMVGSVILMLSVPFLLLAGQCRYYTMSAFFTTLALWSYLRLLEGRESFPAYRNAAIVFVLAALALLHTNHGHGIALLMAVAVHALIWRRERAKTVVALVGGIVLVNLPWLAWMSTSHYNTFSVRGMLVAIWAFVLQLLIYSPHPMFVVAALGLAVAHRKKPKDYRGVSLALTFAVVAIALMAVFVDRPYFRYLCLLLPLGSIFAGRIVTASWRLSRIWTGVVVALWLLTGMLPLYLLELTHVYKGPVGGIVTFLNAHASPGDMVAISYEDLPIKFYTKLRVIGGYAGDDLALVKQAKWIIARKSGNSKLRDYLLQEVAQGDFKKIELDGYPDIGFENRESPYEHEFKTVANKDPVVVYERVQP